MNLCIFIISVARPAGTQNPSEIRGCGCGCRNAPAGLVAGGFFPTSRVCLRAGFRQTRTRTRGCHPYSRVVAIYPTTPCLLLDKFTAPEFRKVARELSDPFFPLPFSLRRERPRPPALLRRRSPQSRLLPRAKPYPPPPRRLDLGAAAAWPFCRAPAVFEPSQSFASR